MIERLKTLLTYSTLLLLLSLLVMPGCKKTEDNPDPVADLADLAGAWIRISSNNPSADGIILNMVGSSGTISFAANSSFSVGDVKWKSVAGKTTNSYAHQELGSDGNYYTGTITWISADEVDVIVDASGAGSSQRWKRYTGTGGDLSKIQGPWTRVESNNPSADFMKVMVVNDIGTLTDKAGSGFVVGDIKWKGITANGPGAFNYEELGSDQNYYASTMKLVNDTTLELTIGSGGAGNSQKWVRNATATTIELDCNYFNQGTTRTLINGGADVDYRVTCVMNVTVAVSIEPGVVIEFGPDAGLGVFGTGSMTAVGTDTEGIVFQGMQSAKGFWRGISFNSNNLDNKLEYVTVTDAGMNYVFCCDPPATIQMNGGQLGMRNVTLSNGAALGMYLESEASFSFFQNVNITGHDDYPISTGVKVLNDWDLTGSDFSGNTKDYILIGKGDILEDLNWPRANIPYLLESRVIDVQERLIIEAGTEIAAKQNAGIGAFGNGSITAVGTPGAPIIFRGQQAAKGFWRGVHLETNSLFNQIKYVNISDAGSDYVFCCNDVASLYLEVGSADVQNVNISNGKNYGIATRAGFSFAGFKEVNITTHDNYPIYLSLEQMGQTDGTGSAYAGNSSDFMYVYEADLNNATTLKKGPVPYLLEGKTIDILQALEIESGTALWFEQNGGLGIRTDGSLKAVGTGAEPIVFRGMQQLQGYWRGIHSETSSVNNTISNARIEDAGSDYVYCCNPLAGLYVKSGTFTLENSSISNSGGCGLYIKAGASVTQSGNSFSNNLGGDICP